MKKDIQLNTINEITNRIESINRQIEKQESIWNPRNWDKYNNKLIDLNKRKKLLWAKRANLSLTHNFKGINQMEKQINIIQAIRALNDVLVHTNYTLDHSFSQDTRTLLFKRIDALSHGIEKLCLKLKISLDKA